MGFLTLNDVHRQQTEHGSTKQGGKLLHRWHLLYFFLKNFIYLFLERGKGRENQRESNINVGNIYRLPLMHPQLGTWPATQACALTGNQTGDLMVHRLALSPLSQISQGCILIYKHAIISFKPTKK